MYMFVPLLPLYEPDQEDKGKQHRPGVEYVTADGGALKNGGDGVLWHRYRGDCQARYHADVAEGNKLPQPPCDERQGRDQKARQT